MILLAEVSVPGHLDPIIFGFQTRWSAEAFQWNMTTALRREFHAHVVKVEFLDRNATEELCSGEYPIFTSIKEVIPWSLYHAKNMIYKGDSPYRVPKEQTFIFTYTIRGTGYNQDDALENALEAFNEYPGEPDNIEVE